MSLRVSTISSCNVHLLIKCWVGCLKLVIFWPPSYSFAMKAFCIALLFVCEWCLPFPFLVMLLLFLSSIHIFSPFFVLHGDSLLYKCKYFGGSAVSGLPSLCSCIPFASVLPGWSPRRLSCCHPSVDPE